MTGSAPTLARTVWMFWHDWAEAPEIARQSVKSWRCRNPDWQIRPLSWADVGDWVVGETIARIRNPDIAIQHQTDLLRLELLSRHGGVWADVTTFCAWPLSDWLPDCLIEGFFAFRRDAQKTPRRNEGISRAGTELMRQLNALALPDGQGRRLLLRHIRAAGQGRQAGLSGANQLSDAERLQLERIMSQLAPATNDERALLEAVRNRLGFTPEAPCP